mmetsp:Transcript_62703/g.101435  ORF Transcript_62703/g.101435 Transcript_62703/m.101435 type:complete len:99 (+) Transcript_62703:97-393(+)
MTTMNKPSRRRNSLENTPLYFPSDDDIKAFLSNAHQERANSRASVSTAATLSMELEHCKPMPMMTAQATHAAVQARPTVKGGKMKRLYCKITGKHGKD